MQQAVCHTSSLVLSASMEMEFAFDSGQTVKEVQSEGLKTSLDRPSVIPALLPISFLLPLFYACSSVREQLIMMQSTGAASSPLTLYGARSKVQQGRFPQSQTNWFRVLHSVSFLLQILREPFLEPLSNTCDHHFQVPHPHDPPTFRPDESKSTRSARTAPRKVHTVFKRDQRRSGVKPIVTTDTSNSPV